MTTHKTLYMENVVRVLHVVMGVLVWTLAIIVNVSRLTGWRPPVGDNTL